jgi:uncharacterized protein (TIGR03435 family)
LTRTGGLSLFSVRLGALVLPLVVGLGNAQVRAVPDADSEPRFEVASIRLSKNPEPGGRVEITPGRFRGTDLALQWLILTAYRINSANLSGNLPGWTISERYTIDAKTNDASGEERILFALRTLLKERFQLEEHREMRDEPVYFLTIGKNGLKMPAGTCVPVKKDLPNECYSARNEGSTQLLDWRGVSVSDPSGVAYRSLAWALYGPLKRPVIDKTGLTGAFDVHLRWARDSDPAAVAQQSEPGEPGAPGIFDAVEQQLGLKLESGRGPVEHLIVDHVDRPGDN